MATAFDRADEAVVSIRKRLPTGLQQPHVAVICGSGLSSLQDALDDEPRVELAYSDIPHMPKPTVSGHEGRMVFGMISGSTSNNGQVPSISVVLLVGRVHFYEGHTMDIVTFATRTCKRLGAEILIVTNAAGGLNPVYNVGDIVMLHDHINVPGLVGAHPLLGPNEDQFGVRFPALSDAYDLALRRRAHSAWHTIKEDQGSRRLHEGIYAFVVGPSYETRAESRMLRSFGADLVGMSTVPEVIVARHAALRVLAFSLVTNKVVMEEDLHGDDQELLNLSEKELTDRSRKGKANHQEVLDAGKEAAAAMQTIVKQIVRDII